MRTHAVAAAMLVLAAPAIAQTPEQSAAAVDTALSSFCAPFVMSEGGPREPTTSLPDFPVRPTPEDTAEIERVLEKRMAEAGMERPALSDALRADGWTTTDKGFRKQAGWGVVTVRMHHTTCSIVADLPDATTRPYAAMTAVDAWVTRTLPGAIRVGERKLNPEFMKPGTPEKDWWYAENGLIVSATAGSLGEGPAGYFQSSVDFRYDAADRAAHEKARQQLLSRPAANGSRLRPRE